MAAKNTHDHEEPHARKILDKLAPHAGLPSGQALMGSMMSAIDMPGKAKELGELIGAWLPKAEQVPPPSVAVAEPAGE